MRLRNALILALVSGAVGAALLAFHFNDRLADAAGATDLGAAPSAMLQWGGFHLTVLCALAAVNLAALLLLIAAFREERTNALIRSQQPPPRPPRAPGASESIGDAAAVSGAPVSEPRPAWPWGAVESWKSDHGKAFAELWNRACEGLYQAAPKEMERFEKLFRAPEFDPEASAAARDAEGKFLGAVLCLRQPTFEDDGYWWLEAPSVVAALLVDPGVRRKGVGRALIQHAEAAAVRRRRPRLFAGGLENFPHLVPGVPDQDHGARVFFTAMGYREVRRTCHMEADYRNYEPPGELVEREGRLKEQGFAFEPASVAHVPAFQEFLDASTLDKPQRRMEKFTNEIDRFFLALKHGRIVGYIHVTAKDERGQSGINLIYFLREFRGAGLGSVLLVKAHELWKTLGATGGTIWTYPEAAARFYPRAGFKTVQEWICYEKDLEHAWTDAAFVKRWR